MKKYFYVLIIIILNSEFGFGQNRNNIWCFGDSSLIDFNTFPPSTSSSIMRTRGTACSISDSTGNLLFYCGSPHVDLWLSTYRWVGVIYNKNHEIMEGGDSLACELDYYEMIIVPDPGNNRRFYLFHFEINLLNTGLYYSIIDLNFYNGLGKVISKNNQLISGNMADGISAVKHGNGNDWWVVARRTDIHTGGAANNDFYLFNVNSHGINPIPVQSIGSINHAEVCCIKFNPTGRKFIFTNGTGLIEEYNFDRCTGLISNPNTLQQEILGNTKLPWSAEYSSSGQYLYISINGDTSYINQYDLYSSNIPASKRNIFTFGQVKYTGGALQRGPDNKIYYATAWYDGIHYNFPYSDTSYNVYNMNLGVINQPDLPDTLCDFQPFSFYLGGKRNYWGLPNNPNYDLGPLVGSSCDTLNIKVNEIDKSDLSLRVYPNPANEYIEFHSNIYKNCNLVITDAIGRVVLKKQLQNGFSIVTGLENGFYTAQILDDNQIVGVQKFYIIK